MTSSTHPPSPDNYFGLAALIESGRDSSVTLAALTPAYAAPEAFHLEPPSPRSDIYALGATLYALLAGRPPRFPAGASPSVPEIIRLHDAPVLDLPGVPTDLTSMLRRALAKDPTRRYPDAAAFRDDLARLTGSPAPISVATRPARAARAAARRCRPRRGADPARRLVPGRAGQGERHRVARIRASGGARVIPRRRLRSPDRRRGLPGGHRGRRRAVRRAAGVLERAGADQRRGDQHPEAAV